MYTAGNLLLSDPFHVFSSSLLSRSRGDYTTLPRSSNTIYRQTSSVSLRNSSRMRSASSSSPCMTAYSTDASIRLIASIVLVLRSAQREGGPSLCGITIVFTPSTGLAPRRFSYPPPPATVVIYCGNLDPVAPAILLHPGNDLPNQPAQQTIHNRGNLIARHDINLVSTHLIHTLSFKSSPDVHALIAPIALALSAFTVFHPSTSTDSLLRTEIKILLARTISF